MPLVSNTRLPTFERLRSEGIRVLEPERASKQDIRELHIGLLNMMPDAALSATERQFFRLIGESNPIAQFHMHPFTLKEIARSDDAKKYINKYYEDFSEIQKEGLDALIITGANVTQPSLEQETFWEPLTKVLDWANENVTSVLCSCLATHAAIQYFHNQPRKQLAKKRWGVFNHKVVNKSHPLVNDIDTRFDVPHSRYNQITREMFDQAKLTVLAESEVAGVHLAVSEDQLRWVYFQGHPEFDTISLLKEYKREVSRFLNKDRDDYPPFPDNYFSETVKAILDEYRDRCKIAMRNNNPLPDIPEALLLPRINNTWHDTGEAVIGNWIGLVYQVTHATRNKAFMDNVDPSDPLKLLPAK